jgi:16S rRNA processing protein RimM
MELAVATIGRAHGLRGEVFIDSRTDEPELRFTKGSVYRTSPDHGPLTITQARLQNGRWVLKFSEVTDRTAAENLNQVSLVYDAEPSVEEDAFYAHELMGLKVELLDGTKVGTVTGFEPGAAQDLLIIEELAGQTTPIPFVKQIVPVVDVSAGIVRIDPPGGLLASDSDRLVISDETIG